MIIININLDLYTKSLHPKVNISQQKVLAAEVDTDKEIVFWQNFLNQNPEYYPGWVELAKLNVEAGNTTEAKEALNNASKIKPNADDLSEVKNLINNSSQN